MLNEWVLFQPSKLFFCPLYRKTTNPCLYTSLSLRKGYFFNFRLIFSFLNDCSSITTAVVDFGIEISGMGGMITAAFTELLMKNMNVISKKNGFILFSLLLKLGFHSLVRVYFWSDLGFPFK